MTAPNHIVGGFIFTGVFGAMSNANIFERPGLIVLTIFAAILPDIDKPGSLISRLMPPLAKWINRKYGHRTITHSLMILFALTLLTGMIQKTFDLHAGCTTVFFLAYFSHLLFDMMTIQGVPLFYPWKKNPCVIPGRPELRFRTSNIRSETSIFAFFLFSGLFLQPLMQDGFWTTYNRLFGTMKHLHSEFTRSDDLLLVHYTYREGTQTERGSGYCVESPSATKATILLDGEFLLLETSKMVISEVLPEHTGKKLNFQTTTFFNISADSLNSLVWDKHILETQIESNQEAHFWTNQQRTTNKKLNETYIADFRIEPIATTYQEEQFIFSQNPKIATLQQKLKRLEEDIQQRSQQIEQHQQQLQQTEQAFEQATDWYEKQQLQSTLTQLRKWKAPPSLTEERSNLQLQLQEIRQLDAIRYETERKKIQQENQAAIPKSTTFSGYFKYIEIL